MTLAEYHFADPRLILLPTEHLAPSGMSRALATLLIWLAMRRGPGSVRCAELTTAWVRVEPDPARRQRGVG